MGEKKHNNEDSSVPWFPALMCYMSYAVLILFGHLRDYLGKLTGKSRYLMKKPSPGYSELLVSWENFYTKRVYHRIQDCFNRPVSSAPGSFIDILETYSEDGNKTLKKSNTKKKCLNLGSYNYLGFADDWLETCSKPVIQTAMDFPIASTSSFAEFGTTTIHVELEKMVADFVGKPAAMIYNMGYGTNSSTIPALIGGEGCLIISDSLNHSSIVNGARSSQAVISVFKHNDVHHLESVLRHAVIEGQPRLNRAWKKIFIMIEGIYSMEGEMVNLNPIVAIAKKYKAYLYVDEAHSIGAIGPTGRGICEYSGVDPADIDILMGTFTKSFGGMGGYIAASEEIINFLRQASAGSIYGTSLSPIIAQQVLTAFKIILGKDGTDTGKRKLKSLRDNSNYFREELKRIGVKTLGQEDSPIIPVLLYSPPKIAEFSRLCLKRNLAVVAVGFPATPLLLARVRFCISASHKKKDLKKAIEDIEEVSKTVHIRFEKNRFG